MPSMAESQGFSRITVTPDEDEDVVIQAGVVEEADGADEPDEPEVFDEEYVAEADDEEEEPPEPDEAPASEVAPVPAAPADDYRETTLDDLTSSKMSTTQKAVILVALLGIIAFAVWYLLAR